MRIMCHHSIIAYLQTLNNKSEMCNVYDHVCITMNFFEMELQVVCLLIARLFLPLAATFPQQFTQYSPHPVQGAC